MCQQELPAIYSFVPLDEAGFQIYSSWFTAGEAKHRVSPPTRKWFEYIQNTPTAHAWLVRGGDGYAIGHVQLDEEADHRASIALVVKPGKRNRGHGRQILRALLALPEIAHLRAIEGMIKPENVASLRCCLAAGFVQASASPDADGLFKFVYMRQKSLADVR